MLVLETVLRIRREHASGKAIKAIARDLQCMCEPTGKTHLATAITANVVRAGARGRYFNTVDLVNRLEEETRLGKGDVVAALHLDQVRRAITATGFEPASSTAQR